MKKIILIAIVCLLCSFNTTKPFNWLNSNIKKQGTTFYYNQKKLNISNDLYLEFLYDYSCFKILRTDSDCEDFERRMHQPYKWSLLDMGDHYVLVLNGDKTHNYTVKR